MTFVIPQQLYVVVTPISAFGSQANQHTVDWAKEYGLVRTAEAERQLAATSPGMLAAHCYPTGGLGDLCLMADWMSWLFTLDDQNDEGRYGWDPELLGKALTELFLSLGGTVPAGADNPLGTALADIVDRTGDRLPVQWRHRFLHHLIDYFTANVWQAAHRREAQVPDPDVFPQMRRDAGAIMPSFDLIEFVESTMLPTRLYYSRTYQRLLITAANVVCWTNDLMTLDKEIARGDNQNLVTVVSHAEDIPLEKAVDDVAKRAGRQIERFLETEADLTRVFDTLRIPDALRATALNCVAMMKAWMRGHVEWGYATARYFEFERSQVRPEYRDDLLTKNSNTVQEA